MNDGPVKVIGIVGSYRRGGVVDTLVTEALAAAEEDGAQTEKIYLIDQRIAFCTNCRQCTQEPGPDPGRCIYEDDMPEILERCGQADALIIGSPVNFFNVTAITRRFMERLICYAYWPWGQLRPKMRITTRNKKAVLITSTAMPAVLSRVLTQAMPALRLMAKAMGARPITSIYAGIVGQKEDSRAPWSAIHKARSAGRKLAKR